MAAERFKAVGFPGSSRGFGQVVNTVFSTLAPDDRTLGDTAATMVLVLWHDLQSDPDFEKWLDGTGQCAVEVLGAIGHKTRELDGEAIARAVRTSGLEGAAKSSQTRLTDLTSLQTRLTKQRSELQ